MIELLNKMTICDINDSPIFTHTKEFREYFDYIKKEIITYLSDRASEVGVQPEVIAGEQQDKVHANGAAAEVWSYEEFELSEKTNLTPAIYQFILRKNGTAILYSDELTRKDSNWAQMLRELLPNIIMRLNQKATTLL